MINRTHIFKQKQQDTPNKTNMAISVLLDSSGSVGGKEHKIQLDTSFIIAKALEMTKNKIEVIEFTGNLKRNETFKTDSEKFKIIKSFNQKTEQGDFKRHFCHGNELNPPLRQALKDLNYQPIKNKYVIVVTDGNLTKDGNTILQMTTQAKKLNDNGIRIYCILINNRDSESYNFFDKVIRINNFDNLNIELNKLILDIQKKIMLKNGVLK